MRLIQFINLRRSQAAAKFHQLMRTTIFNLFLLSSSVFAAPIFIGTGDKAIYLADFDAKTGKLTEPSVAAEYNGPGWIDFHPTKPILYSVGSPKAPFEDKTGAIAAFKIGDGNKLEFIGETSSGGKGPCHLVVDATGGTLAVANYGDGTTTTIKLSGDGSFDKIATTIIASGNGPTDRQKTAHAHGVYFDKSNAFLLMPDLGVDKVLVFKFDAKTSEITPAEPLKTAPGAGPRHLAFSPDEKHAYVINELDNTIVAASYDGKGGLKEVQTVPTLPSDFSGRTSTSEIEVHQNGKFVYGSNRGHDTIAVYARDEKDGKLTLIQHAPCGGKNPRHFKIDPSGKWMIVGHQDSNTISVLPLDQATGKLGEAVSTVSAPKPICILFGK
jgi:6-phosphogluconolactonase